MMQIKLHPGKRQAGSPRIASHKEAAAVEACLPFPPHSPSYLWEHQSPQSPRYLLHLGPQRTPPTLGPQPPSIHTHTHSWALGPPEPEGHAGGAQRPALLGRQDGGSGGAGRAGLLHAAPEGGAGGRHRAAPRGARPRVRLFSELLPLGNHVSETQGAERAGSCGGAGRWGNWLPHHGVRGVLGLLFCFCFYIEIMPYNLPI